ncbi:unnamed protein product [Brachionus calyciflorus]|uniref:Uncharacterized protein n=1 Tax=Brachionus calyciflorus TaxID=104777 RepID=A0A814MJ27_9BILA|nr:unnamed protein product [Brachionus calyciflorus]
MFLKLIQSSLSSIILNWEKNYYQEIDKFLSNLSNFENMFKFIDTSYKQHKMIESNQFYTKPVQYLFGQRMETEYLNGKFNLFHKNETFQYVSIKNTIANLLKNDRIKDEIKNFNFNIDFKPFLFSNSQFWKNKNTLRLLIYYDEIEIKNSLVDIAGGYKLGMFYFNILNLTRKHNSNLKNIFVIAATFSEDLKKYGFDDVFQLIIDEINELETNGIQIDNEFFYASIAQLCGDNLGVHQAFNLKMNFNGKNICHLCDASTSSIQTHLKEECFKKTTKSIYDARQLEIKNDSNKTKEYGMRGQSILNNSKFYHISNNFAFDVTHDIWEGVSQFEMALVLENLFYNEKLFSLDFLNQRIIHYDFTETVLSNKPSIIKCIKGKIKVKQTIAKMKCLF